MKTRILSGIVLILVLLTALLHSNESYYILVSIIIFGVTEEISSITKKKYSLIINCLLLGLVLVLSFLKPYLFTSTAVCSLFIGIPLALMTLELTRKELFKSPLFCYLRPTIFLAPLFPYFILIKADENSNKILILSILVISLCDTFAYFVGKIIGKTQLSTISPNKTIEGSIGGLFFATIGAAIYCVLIDFPMYPFIPLSICIGVVSQFGDLHESLFKRIHNIKDSSNLIPGHGGIYDRTDSYIFTIPLIYWLIHVL
jgi:phosphatidate cytidylyltransferase